MWGAYDTRLMSCIIIYVLESLTTVKPTRVSDCCSFGHVIHAHDGLMSTATTIGSENRSPHTTQMGKHLQMAFLLTCLRKCKKKS